MWNNTKHPMAGTLFIVATPIGNMEDLTARARRILGEVKLVACEDTRQASKIVRHIGAHPKFVAVHEHTQEHKIQQLIDVLKQGEDIAYVSDAGTPGVNDPGGKFVAKCFEQGITVVPIPGPSALTAAISVCGFPMDDFVYVGFLPHKKGRETMIREMSERMEATVFFESPHRIERALVSLHAALPSTRLVFIGRELTKMHETLYRGNIDEVAEQLHHTSLKGEFVGIIAPKNFHS